MLNLSGEFEFYWNKLYKPSDFKDSSINHTEYAYVPSVWNNKYFYDKKVTPQGFATYRLNITVPKDEIYGLKIKELNCAYKLMVNGESVQIGQVGINKNSTIPSWKRAEIFFCSKNKQIELVLQIANFHHRKGGPEDAILFGRAQTIKTYKVQQAAMSIFLCGVLFILAAYFLLIYTFGHRELCIAWFCMLCFLALFRLLTTGEKVLLDLIPNLSWNIAIRIEYLSFCITSAITFSFLRTFFKQVFKQWVEHVVWWITSLSSIPTIFASSMLFTYIPIYYQWVILLLGAYVLIGLLVAMIKRLEFSTYFFIGIFFFYICIINDVLYYNKMVNSDYLMPYGLFILFFSFSFVMSKHQTYAFGDVEKLKSAHVRQTKLLEKQVKKRTNEIIRQKESIQEQAIKLEQVNKKLIELNRFRDDMIGMIVHDLKNPLNSIINLVMMKDIPEKDKLIRQAGIEMHNMVLNILDVNKAEEVGFLVDMQPTNFNEVINEAVNDVSIAALKKGVNIKQNKTALNFIVSGDKDVLKRVLINLLINALRFSPTNGIINIVLNKKGENDFLCIIKDQGPGIEKDQQQLIFDRYKSSELSKKRPKSSGLGLTFCKLAIEAHKGSIYVNSKPSEGSEFCIVLPIKSSHHQNIREEKKENKVNCLEINIDNKKLLKPFLEKLQNKEVFEVSDIASVIDEIRELKIEGANQVIKRIQEAVFACNQKKYDEIINSLIKKDVQNIGSRRHC